MGKKSSDVQYLEYAEEKGLGTANLDDIDIIGEKIEQVSKIF